MDKLDIWIYIILFILVPIGNALLGTKKKKPTAKNMRTEQQPEKEEEWWREETEEWKELVGSDTEPVKKIELPQKSVAKIPVFLQPENKKRSFTVEKMSKPVRKDNQEKDVYAIDKDDTFVVDNSELRKAVVMAEILAKKF